MVYFLNKGLRFYINISACMQMYMYVLEHSYQVPESESLCKCDNDLVQMNNPSWDLLYRVPCSPKGSRASITKWDN